MHQSLTKTIESEAASFFERLLAKIKPISPDAKNSVHRKATDTSVELILSILNHPSGDQLEFGVELNDSENHLRCEVLMYVGQGTPLIMRWSYWTKDEPLEIQIARVVREFTQIAESHAEAVFRQIVAADAAEFPST